MGFWDFLTGTTPAGIVSETGQKVVGSIFTGVKDIISEFHLSPDEKAKLDIRIAELQLQTMTTQMQDVQSARAMQMQTHSHWPGILSSIITVGFFTALGLIIKYGLPALDANGGQAILILLGTLTAGFTTVVSFWLGTSRTSQAKDEMIWKSVPADTVPKKT